MKPSALIAAIVASGGLLGIGIAAGMALAPKPAPGGMTYALPMTATGQPVAPSLESLQSLNQTFVQLASDAAPSVVEIRPLGSGGDARMMGGGSGFIYSPDGWIVTNDHVTGGAKKVTVILHDGRDYEGTVYSPQDDQLDVALVKIEKSGLKPLTMADSDQVKAGQFAFAIGSPFGYESTVTIGHVSATNRPGVVMDPRTGARRVYEGMIQTDAAINPGNSGGPLLDIYGRVIGVNSTISTTTGGSNGIGFSLPAKTVKAVADEMVATKKFNRGYLGIVFQNGLKPFQLKEMGIDGGALAGGVPQDTPAYKAGLRDNDVILKVDNDKIRNQNDLLISTYRRSPGDQVEVTFKRGSQVKTARVTLMDKSGMKKITDRLEQMEEKAQPDAGGGDSQPRARGRVPDMEDFFKSFGPDFFDRSRVQPRTNGQRPRLGITIESPTAENRKQFQIPSSEKGVIVTGVQPGGLASSAGLAAGALIREINGASVATPEDVSRALAKVKVGDMLRLKYTVYKDGAATQAAAAITFQ